jgi:hypothetical protein
LTILASGSVILSGHVQKRLVKHRLAPVDVHNVLRGGIVEPAEFVENTWRYRVRTARIFVVVAFRSEEELSVVTAWRLE